MTKTIVFFIFVIFILSFKESESQDVYDLWKGEAKPYYKENDLKEYEEEAWGTMCLFDVTEPILTVYKAQGKTPAGLSFHESDPVRIFLLSIRYSHQ